MQRSITGMRNKFLENKYRNNRTQRYESGDLRIRNLRLHRVANHLMVLLIRIQRKFKKQRLIIVGDKKHTTQNPILFSPMHIGGIDVEIVFESIRQPSWLMLADCREMYRKISGMMLDLNGVITFDTAYKEDRHIAKMRSIELLKRGENLIVFSEGAYNISPNQLVMHPYVGTADIAITTGADIVPIAIVRDGSTYYVNIGENINTQEYSIDQRFELIGILRDVLATLSWEIIETLPVTKRMSLCDDYYDKVFLKEMFADNDGYTYTVQDVNNTLFKPKGLVEPQDAFAFMDMLQPKKENAFLFRRNQYNDI